MRCRGAYRKAERKVCPSTREPDLDNANVGKNENFSEISCQVSSIFL